MYLICHFIVNTAFSLFFFNSNVNDRKEDMQNNVILRGDAKEGWGNAELVTLHDWRHSA